MAEIFTLKINWKVLALPRFRTEEDAEKLRRRCERLFRIKGTRKMVVTLRNGDTLDSLSIDKVINSYRCKNLAYVEFIEAPLLLLTKSTSVNEKGRE